MIPSIGSVLKGVLCGAGFMYFFDPDRGRRRRAGVADRAVRLAHDADALWQKGCRDLTNRSLGLAAEARRLVAATPADERLLVARVRAVLGHHVCDAHAIDVGAQSGTVTLRGTVRPGEPEQLIPAIENVPGVRGVESSLTIAGEPYEPCADAGRLRPGTRLLMTAGGGLLMLNCLVRRGFGPSLLGTAGLGLLVRGLTDHPGRLVGVGRDRGIDMRRSIRIDAPVEKVFEFLSDVEQSGRLFPHVVGVEQLGAGRVRWTLEGPAGVGRFTCEEQLLESVENERIVWGSADGAPIRYVGEARFMPEEDATRLDVRLNYEPPGGVITHAAASLFGVDPKTHLDRYLNRIKRLLEDGAMSPAVLGEAAHESQP